MTTDVERRTVTVPATPMQEALWWIHQRAKNKSVYTITWRLTCDKAVDLDALAVAWQAVVDRHEALRTSVVRPAETVQMVVHPSVRVQVGLVEADEADATDADTLLRLIAEEAQDEELPLDGEALARLTAVRIAGRHELVLSVHHLVVDGWALQLVAQDLSDAYAAVTGGGQPAFDGDVVPFREYAAEQHTEEARTRWAASLEHWRTTLDGTVATTLAASSSGAFVPGNPGQIIRHTFSDGALAGITTLSGTTYATPLAIFHGAMHIVLARGGAGENVAICAVMANRMTPRDQAIVGYTANLCVSKGYVPDSDRILDVVTRARDSVWGMLTHQAVPYPLVFNALPESTRRTLTDDSPIGLSHLGPIGTGLRLGDVGLTLEPSPNRATRSDISISTWEADGGYFAEIEFDTTRYSEDVVKGLLADLDDVLAASTEPERLVGSVNVRSRAAAAHLDHVAAAAEPATGELEDSAAWQRVAALWTEIVGAPPAGPDVDFFASGGNSLGLLRLTGELEESTGDPIDVVEWLPDPTPRRLVEQLGGEAAADGPDATTLVSLREGAGPHIHLLHGAGGTPNDFRDIVAALPEDWRVTASREHEPLPGVAVMARRYHQDLDAAGLRPDVLCGWSMGGMVAYEIAAHSKTPPVVVLLDSPPPVGYEPDPEDALFAGFAAAFVGAGDGAAAIPRAVGEPWLRTRALAAALAANGTVVPAGVLAQRWNDYVRHARAGEGYVGPDAVAAPGLVVGASFGDAELREWARRFDEAEQLRVDADHHGVLRGDVAARIAADIVRFGTTYLERTSTGRN